MKDFFKSLYTNKTRLAVSVILILLVVYFAYKHYNPAKGQVSYVLGTAENETIISTVSGTGQVSQDRTVNLTPATSGKITQVLVKQGDAVKAGQTIAVVDETSNVQSINQARASVASAQANYNSVLAGATSQDVQLSQLSVDSAQASLDQANQNLVTVTKQQAQNVQNAETSMLSSGLSAIATGNNLGTGNIAISGTYTSNEQGSYMITVFNSGNGQYFSASGLESDYKQITKNAPMALGTRGLFITFSGTPYNNDSWTINIPNTQSSSYNSAYNSYQSSLTTQASAILSAQNQITSAQNNLKQAQINQQVKVEPATDQEIESAQASLTSAQAQLANAELSYQNNILKAPFDGIVATLSNQVGDQVSASTNVATVVTNQSISVIALNEIDVAKVKVGDKATMTFSAIDDLTITGKVVQIDTLGTVSQGVVSYNVKVAFDTEDDRVKPGMSVTVNIITDTQADVLSVPSSAIQAQGASSYVLVVDPSKTVAATGQQGVIPESTPTRVMVTTGASDDTYTQITNGSLKEGDSVVTQTVNPTAAKSTASTATSALRIGGGATGAFGGGAAAGGTRTFGR